MFGEEQSRVIPRKARRRQDQRSCLTNKDGLVVLSKSTLLTKLWNEWGYLLDPTQLLNLCFFFECPISHHKYTEANTNDSLDLLGPFSRSRWNYMTKIHVLFPSDVGHMYIAKRGDIPHYQEVFSKLVLALERYDNQMPFLHYSTHLTKRFGLTLPETIGVMSAIEVLPNTAYYFCAAAQALLSIRTSDLSRCHRGFAFGYLVAKLLLHLRRINSGHCPGTRFNIYWDPELPSATEWKY
jgi:hypothetical protein